MGTSNDRQPRLQGWWTTLFATDLIIICTHFNFNSFNYSTFFPLQGEWKPKQIDNPNYKGEWIHPEIDNPEYQPDDKLYKYDDIGAIGFDLWQVSHNCFLFTTCDLSKSGV